MTTIRKTFRSSLPTLLLVASTALPASGFAYGPRNTLPDQPVVQNAPSACGLSPIASGPRSTSTVDCRANAEFAAAERHETMPALEWADFGPRVRMVGR